MDGRRNSTGLDPSKTASRDPVVPLKSTTITQKNLSPSFTILTPTSPRISQYARGALVSSRSPNCTATAGSDRLRTNPYQLLVPTSSHRAHRVSLPPLRSLALCSVGVPMVYLPDYRPTSLFWKMENYRASSGRPHDVVHQAIMCLAAAALRSATTLQSLVLHPPISDLDKATIK